MKIYIINGPNLNRLGKRDPAIYGEATFEDTLRELTERFPDHTFDYYQSNSEGDIIDKIQNIIESEAAPAIIINPGAYAHYSYAIADCMADAAATADIVEVHISNIHARESFRQHSVTAASATAMICGAGREGYALAASFLIKRSKAG